MLSTHFKDGYLRKADNFLPTAEGGVETRPGAVQLLDGHVSGAVEWGSRLVVERAGRLLLLDGSTTTNLCAAGRFLFGSNFQALTQNAQREDRLYIADGIRSLWYLAWRNGAVVRETVVNSVVDSAGQPYPIPVPTFVTTWRGRLWLCFGSNRIQHCQFDAPAYWDPLWTLEFQGPKQDKALSLLPFKDALVVGLNRRLGTVVGTSHLNWVTDVLAEFGCAGPLGLASDGDALFAIDTAGVNALGMGLVSDDVRELFGEATSAVCDRKTRLLWLVLRGRLLVMHLGTRRFGEVTGFRVSGVFTWSGRVGWYGHDGVWLLRGTDMDDLLYYGTERAFECVWDRWTDIPNTGGEGRAWLSEVVVVGEGSARGAGTYEAWVDGVSAFTQTFTLADETVERWADDMTGKGGEAWPTDPIRRALHPGVSGGRFRHVVRASGTVRLASLTPRYQFGGE